MNVEHKPVLVSTIVRAMVLVWVVLNIGLLIWVFIASIRESADIFSQRTVFQIPLAPHWENYAHAWTNSSVGRAMLNTVVVVAISSALVVVISAPAAYALSRFPNRSAGFLANLFAIGMGIPIPAIVLPLYIAYAKIGLVNSLAGLTILYVATSVPFTVFLLTGFFRSLPFELEEAAAVDGASIITTLRRIMVPLAAPGIITAFVLNVVLLWNETALVLYFIQDPSKFTLGRALLNLGTIATYTSDWGALFAGAFIIVMPVVVLYFLLSRRITEGLTLGADK